MILGQPGGIPIDNKAVDQPYWDVSVRIEPESSGLALMMKAARDISLRIDSGGLQVSDPSEKLKECVVFFAFPKSRSENFPIALSLAKAAPVFGVQDVGGRCLHWAGFTNATGDLKRAAELLRLAGRWVGAITRINGHNMNDSFGAHLTISCYLKALQCRSQSAHCHKVIDDPLHPDFDLLFQTVRPKTQYVSFGATTVETEEEIKQYVFPCKRMLEFSMFHPQFRFERTPQVSVRDQIQAAAVEHGVNICPYFDASAFKEVESRKIKIEVPVKGKRKLLR